MILEKLTDVDWIIEVVVENLETKKNLFERVDAVRKDRHNHQFKYIRY